MSLRDGESGYGWPARLMHWAVAALILLQLALGFWMVEAETDLIARLEQTQLHKSIGFVAFALALLRILWRFANRGRPRPEPGMAAWQERAALVGHRTLYLLTLALPLSGWLMASASPLNDTGAVPFRIPNMVFGLFEMPDPFPTGSERLSATFGAVHMGLALMMIMVLAIHAGAALWHQFGRRDRVLVRMIRG